MTPPTTAQKQEALHPTGPTCRQPDQWSDWRCDRPAGHDGPHVEGGSIHAHAWWTDGGPTHYVPGDVEVEI